MRLGVTLVVFAVACAANAPRLEAAWTDANWDSPDGGTSGGEVRNGVFAAVPTAGPSWRPELRESHVPHAVMERSAGFVSGESMIGADNDGSKDIVEAFCQSCLTGEKAENVVEEAYCATILCLMGNQAMDEKRVVVLPDAYKIPYMKF